MAHVAYSLIGALKIITADEAKVKGGKRTPYECPSLLCLLLMSLVCLYL